MKIVDGESFMFDRWHMMTATSEAFIGAQLADVGANTLVQGAAGSLRAGTIEAGQIRLERGRVKSWARLGSP